MSYYLDYYIPLQYTREGNFAQFVYNSHWNEGIKWADQRRIDSTWCRRAFELFQQQCKS
jgi:hypothetical protein